MLTKSSRFFIRLHPAHKQDIRRAAKRAGMTISAFVLKAVLDRLHPPAKG